MAFKSDTGPSHHERAGITLTEKLSTAKQGLRRARVRREAATAYMEAWLRAHAKFPPAPAHLVESVVDEDSDLDPPPR